MRNRALALLALVAALALAHPATVLTQRPSDLDTATFAGLKFRNIGPASMGGRIDDFAVLETNPAVFYVAAATGGLWKTTTNGTTWEVLFNSEDDVVSIGDVAIAPDDAETVWVGTGENNNRQSSSWGTGVYKSTDGGHTWKSMGLSDARHIARIVVDPTNHDVVYVAALGHLFGPNRERGIYKTTDGGRTWSNVLFVDQDTGATELVMDPSNHDVLYAATYQRRRSSWGFNGGGPGSAIYKSSDAGRTWNKLTNGIPSGPMGRIGLDVFRGDPRILYARVEHATETGIYRSDDAGASWRKATAFNPRPMYFSQIRIDPSNADRIYVLGVWLAISSDGGKSFHEITTLHPDFHAMWIDPHNPRHILAGEDGGVGLSYDLGGHWSWLDNMDLGQFYHVSFDMESPYGLYGGAQDNDAFGGPSATRRRHGIGNDQWFNIAAGDGFVALADPRDSRVIYAESQNGNVSRVDPQTTERKVVKPEADKGEAQLRWNWDTPMIMSPHETGALLMGANRLYRSGDGGHSWRPISDDLTAKIDRDTLSLMGVRSRDVVFSRNDGVGAYGTLTTIAESPKKAGLYYTGADDGTVSVSRDGGQNWTNVSRNFPGLPERTYVSAVAPSAFDEGVAYATFDGHREDDYKPYVYATRDYGRTWTSIANNLPNGQAVRCITEDPRNGSVLYLGTEFGLFVSVDKGQRWVRIRSGLPTVPVAQIIVHPRDNDLIVATHGRSFWILDDATPIQQTAAALNAPATLFDIRAAMQYFDDPEDRSRWMGDSPFWGRNPEPGAAVSYLLREPVQSLKLTVRDTAGITIAELDAPKNTGINRVQWDLRHQALALANAPGTEPPGPTTFFADPRPGPFVLPGEYRVTLSVNGRDAGTKTVRVSGDRLVNMSDADRRTWHDTSLALHRLQRSADQAAELLVAIDEQLTALRQVVRANSSASPPVEAALTAATNRSNELHPRLGVPIPGQRAGGGGGGGGGANRNVRGRVTSLKTQIMNATSLPTASQATDAQTVRQDLETVVKDTNGAISGELATLIKAMTDSGAYRMPALRTLTPVTMPDASGRR